MAYILHPKKANLLLLGWSLIFLSFCDGISAAGITPTIQQHVDSVMALASTDSRKSLLRYCNQRPDNSIEACYQYALQHQSAMAVSEYRGEWHCGLGKYFISAGNLKTAGLHFDSAYTIANRRNYPRLLSRVTHLKGFLNHRLGNYKSALDHYYRALEINYENGYETAILRTRIKIIRLYFHIGEFDKARKELIKVGAAFGENSNLTYYNNLAQYYQSTDKADSCVHILQLMQSRIADTSKYQTYADALISMCSGDTNTAISRFELYMKDAGHLSPVDLIMAELQMAKLYNAVKDIDKAEPLLLRVLNKAERQSDYHTFMSAVNQLEQLYEKQQDFKAAWAIHLRKNNYQNEIRSVQDKEILFALEERFRTERKQQEIEDLKLVQRSNDERDRFKNWIIALLVVGLIATVFVSLLLARLSRSRNAIRNKLEESNEKLINSLADKEILLKEIHHRVKNNLQIISSLLNLQRRFIKDSTAADVIQDSRNRVKSMALVHQQLYDNDHLQRINMKKYIDQLSNSLKDTFNATHAVDIHCVVDDIQLDIDHAIPVGLIVNELITNSFKHGFKRDSEHGQIHLSLTQDKGQIMLVVKDNGAGTSMMERQDDAQHFGSQMIRSMAKKLKATVEIATQQGYQTIITFNSPE